MSKAKNEERRWKEFERQLAEAIEKDKAVSEEQHRAWLDTLPEYIPPPTGDRVTVIFMGAGKSSEDKHSHNIFAIHCLKPSTNPVICSSGCIRLILTKPADSSDALISSNE